MRGGADAGRDPSGRRLGSLAAPGAQNASVPQWPISRMPWEARWSISSAPDSLPSSRATSRHSRPTRSATPRTRPSRAAAAWTGRSIGPAARRSSRSSGCGTRTGRRPEPRSRQVRKPFPARWVIHAVGPVWRGGDHGELVQLAGAYRSVLSLAAELGARTLTLPAISAGATGTRSTTRRGSGSGRLPNCCGQARPSSASRSSSTRREFSRRSSGPSPCSVEGAGPVRPGQVCGTSVA